MNKVSNRVFLRRVLPITLFVLGCFPSRGLYFLLHPATPDGRYHAHHPALNAPASPTPKLKAAKVPLPARLTRVPRSLRKIPIVTDTAHGTAPAFSPRAPASRTVPSARNTVFSPPVSASPPPGRAPPADA